MATYAHECHSQVRGCYVRREWRGGRNRIDGRVHCLRAWQSFHPTVQAASILGMLSHCCRRIEALLTLQTEQLDHADSHKQESSLELETCIPRFFAAGGRSMYTQTLQYRDYSSSSSLQMGVMVDSHHTRYLLAMPILCPIPSRSAPNINVVDAPCALPQFFDTHLLLYSSIIRLTARCLTTLGQG